MDKKSNKSWDIAFVVLYIGRRAFFENRNIVLETMKNVAYLQGFEFYLPDIPFIIDQSTRRAITLCAEGWIEYYYFRSGECPIMPRYMFARLICSIFQRYGENSKEPIYVYQCSIAETNSLKLSERATKG